MELGQFSKQVFVDGKIQILNTVTGVMIDDANNEKTLSDNLCLAGQEKQAVWARVFRQPRRLTFFVLPTLNCSLRCPFCYVLHSLKAKEDLAELNQDLFFDFISRWLNKYRGEEVRLGILGGEPLLNPDHCIAALNVLDRLRKEFSIPFNTSLTSNLAVDLTEKHFILARRLSRLNASLDGLPEVHNKQRIPFKADFDPFEKTFKNIKRLVDAGVRVFTQTTLPAGESWNKEQLTDFVHALLCIGVRKEDIFMGSIAPTKVNKDIVGNDFTGCNFFPKPCCSMRYMNNFTLYQNKLYGNYFDVCDETLLGDLSTPLDQLEARFHSHIEEYMPILQDETCMSCPALGVCWGQCLTNRSMTGNKPSNFCKQSEMIHKLDDMLQNVQLVQDPYAGTMLVSDSKTSQKDKTWEKMPVSL